MARSSYLEETALDKTYTEDKFLSVATTKLQQRPGIHVDHILQYDWLKLAKLSRTTLSVPSVYTTTSS